ncbi:serine/threonine protein kinase [Streptomyces sp. NBC_01591]|uniref:serine/threonine-protein kinase n=1 Tax=Streptomyces sp. NBC_01591 TaxID=2975888 RepID=UPI002DD93BB6|nr:serine/threonine-protein kinase [Streptomyces sp. NBC_01591]WSD69319.1 serine/threonine protein kinase [Streptomyces sp. NBC_01591]
MQSLTPQDPRAIGAYRLLGRLGAGGMGQVYLARSDRGRTVAIKLVRGELAEQQEFRDRFRHEVRAARQVGSAWTAPVLDADTEAAVPWVATGYVAGPSLHATVTGRSRTPEGAASGAYGPLPERSVHILGAGLTHALQAIHAAGLIHRDLKPSNILLTIDGPRVIDFGIARALDTVTDGGVTRTGALVGSPGFMAPEQVRGERVTPACDVFCLGSVLAYASTGRLPFGTSDSRVHAQMFRIAQEDPDLTGVPVDLVELIRDCLHKDPAARPTTDAILERLADGDTAEPWLPGALIAQLGRHAVELLDSEDPEEEAAAGPAPVTDKSPPAPAPPTPSTPPADRPVHTPPTTAGAPTPPPAPASAPPPGAPAYGYPPLPAQPHPGQGFGPQQNHAGYGYPQQQYHQPQQQPGFGPTPPYGPTYPTAPQPGPEPARRGKGSTIALVAVAVLVAIGAGGSVYALMNGKAPGTTASPTGSPSSSDTSSGSPATDDPSSPDPSTTDDQQNSDGPIPSGYLGTWSGSIDNAAGHSTRKLVIQQGAVGESVLTLTADGPLDTGGSYHCVFQADLTTEPSPGGPVEVGPSTVTVGEPMTSCTAGKATTLTLLPDGSLRRENNDSGEQLTYTKDD